MNVDCDKVQLDSNNKSGNMSVKISNHVLGNINQTEELSDQMCQLYMSDKYSDVVFIVEGQRIPAHKYILAVRNQYFESLLYGGLSESNQKEIELNVPLEPFNAFLRYVYSGQMNLPEMKEQTILDILSLTNKYGFTTLELAVTEYLKEIIGLNNIAAIFNVAWLCEFADLKKANLLAHESFNHFSKQILQELLRRDSFIAPEFQIFTAVSDWCKYHPDVDADSVTCYVRLPLMNLKEIVKVLHTGIVKQKNIIDAMEWKDASKKLPYRVLPEENMVALKFKSALTASCYNGIFVELHITGIINHISFMLSKSNQQYSYFVEVSVNQSQWEKVADYRDSHCHSLQKLYFPPRFVKYIKLVGTRLTGLTIYNLRAIYTEVIPKLVNDLICGSLKICGTGISGHTEVETALLNNDYNYQSKSRQVVNQLDQLYYINSLQLYLWDHHGSYNYNVDISMNGQDWFCVMIKTNETTRSWQTVSIPPYQVVFIKIIATTTYCNNSSKCIFIEEAQPTSDREVV